MFECKWIRSRMISELCDKLFPSYVLPVVGRSIQWFNDGIISIKSAGQQSIKMDDIPNLWFISPQDILPENKTTAF